jgi:hypothetical protein
VWKAATYNPDELVLPCSLAFAFGTREPTNPPYQIDHGKFRFGHMATAGFSEASIPLPPNAGGNTFIAGGLESWQWLSVAY